MRVKGIYIGDGVIELAQQEGFSARLVKATFTPNEPLLNEQIEIESNDIITPEIGDGYIMRGVLSI
jgi:hypothetical protein